MSSETFPVLMGSLDETDYEELLRDQNFTAADIGNATIEQKRNLLMALQPPIELTDVLPPPNHDDVQVQVMAVGYMLLFLLGTCGNVAVLTTIYQMVRSRRANLDNTLIYMVVLSCVDFGVCLSLPFTVIDQILGFWMFGSTMCKLHAVLENFGKILSALIITAMSFDRFAGVCHSEKRFLRSRRVAFGILIGMTIYALVALCPLLYNFEAREVILFQKATGPNKITRMRIEKCTMVDMVRWTFTLFTCFLFVLCYLVPLFLVTFFYAKLLSKLHHHARQFKTSQIRSQIPLMRISLYTLAVACFYFICWTPFWVATAFAVYLEYAGESNGQVPPVFVYFMYFIHALPFTNSAVNWILYGALNGQLQQRVRHGTVHGGGGGPLTSVSVALGRTTQNDFERPTTTMTMMLNGHLSNTTHHPSSHSQHSSSQSHLHQQQLQQQQLCASSQNALLKSSNSPMGSGCRHSSSIDVACCGSKRPSISPAQSIQQNSSISSFTQLASKERRPSCPAGNLELQQIIELNGNNSAVKNGQMIAGKRYRRRISSTKQQFPEQTSLDGMKPTSEGHKQNGIKSTTKMNGGTQMGGINKKERTNYWDMTEERHENGHREDDDEEEEEEEQSLLLHSTDSINCLLRIDSQTSTFL